MNLVCPLCLNYQIQYYCNSDVNRSFQKCEICSLVFTINEQVLSAEDEKSRYMLHENNLTQIGYREYLGQMWESLLPILLERKNKTQNLTSANFSLCGLDFGCGPTEAFAQFAKEFDFEVKSYDPYFFNKNEIFENKYDFIWCSESFEHFNHPKTTINKIISLLKPEGLLAIRTESYPPPEQFKKWYYQRDPTHVVFYNLDTMKWIAQNWDLKLRFNSKNIFIFEG